MLSCKNITKTYGKTTALLNASIEIEPGDIMMILGKNGSGKSTLMSIMAMSQKADSGTVNVDDLDRRNARSKIGYVPQDIALFEDLTVEENLKAFSKMSPAQTVERIDVLLGQLDLSKEKRKLVRNLSGGQKRRINLAAALIIRPDYLILDEPLAGVDTESEERIIRLLCDYAKIGTGIIISSHQPRQLRGIANKCLKLDHGNTVFLGMADDYFEQLKEQEI